MPEVLSEVVSDGSRTGSGGATARPIISQSVTAGSLARVVDKPDRGQDGASGGAIDNVVKPGGGRSLSESTRTMLANLDKYGTIATPKDAAKEPAKEAPAPSATESTAGSAPAAATAAEAQPATQTTAATTATPTVTPATTPAQPAAAPEVERLTARNRELLEENAKLKQGGSQREPSPREKALDEIERGYLDDSVGAVRRLIAVALGHEDPKHADVDAELKGLLQDLTAHDLGVSIDQSQQAIRETARTKHILARDKRERTAEQEAAASKSPESFGDPDAGYHSIIGTRLQERQADGKTVAESNPVLKMLGPKPEAVLFQAIKRGLEAGELDPKDDNNTLIQQAISKINDHFRSQHQALAGIYGGATATSTATPTATETATKDVGQGQAPRSITNANASVAPATPPAKPETTAKPRYKSEADRRKAIVSKHTGD